MDIRGESNAYPQRILAQRTAEERWHSATQRDLADSTWRSPHAR